MSKPRDQHLVSASLLRAWTVDGFLEAHDLAFAKAKLRSPRSEGFIRGFIRNKPDAAESAWKQYEDRIPTVHAALQDGSLLDLPKVVDDVRDLFALHFARSRTVTIAYLRSMQGAFGRLLDDPEAILNNPRALDLLFEKLTGLIAAGPGARMHAREVYEAEVVDRMGLGSDFFAERLEANRVQMREMLDEKSFEVGIATEGEFVIGDDPLQTASSDHAKVGILSGVAISDADTLAMPFGPRFAIAVSEAPSWVDMNADAVDRMNRIQIITAEQKVFARPGSELAERIRLHRATRLPPTEE